MTTSDALRAQLRLPLFAAPMFLVSGPDLVIAAARAGIIGSFPTPNCRTTAGLDAWMARITEETADFGSGEDHSTKLWSANLIVHRTNARLAEDMALVKKYRPPIVITALGSPRAIVDDVHDYGGLVFADVNGVAHARKAAAAGVDGLVLVCAGAGGHTGRIAPFAFVPEVRKFFDGMLIVSGAMTDGRAVAAARALGADFGYAGTRFIACAESMAPDAYRQMVVDAGIDDLVLTSALTGALASMLRPSVREAGFDPDALVEGSTAGYTHKTSENRAWKSVWSAGQGVGLINSVKTVAEIVDDFAGEYEAALAALCTGPASS
ncbi:MAG: nitronate monooxygenase [Alphaproteobacteria bacterium]|nr:nitronate monooxygenase [Alphaproteobacteria bacterium]